MPIKKVSRKDDSEAPRKIRGWGAPEAEDNTVPEAEETQKVKIAKKISAPEPEEDDDEDVAAKARAMFGAAAEKLNGSEDAVEAEEKPKKRVRRTKADEANADYIRESMIPKAVKVAKAVDLDELAQEVDYDELAKAVLAALVKLALK